MTRSVRGESWTARGAEAGRWPMTACWQLKRGPSDEADQGRSRIGWSRSESKNLGRTCLRKSAQVKLLDAVLNSATGSSPQHFKNGFGRRAKNVDARGGVQRLLVRPRGPLLNYAHVELKRIRIGMDLNDAYLCSFVVRVLVEGNHARFIGFDEVDQPRYPPALGL